MEANFNCFKLLLYIFNGTFIAVGIVLVGIGIWSAADKIYVSSIIGDSLFSATSYMLIGVGGILVTICIIGICSLMKEDAKWLMIYLGSLIFSFLVLITAAILAIIFKTEVESMMAEEMKTSLRDKYGQNKQVTAAWDQLQKDLSCCAVSSTPITSVDFRNQYADGAPVDPNERNSKFRDSWLLYKYTEFYGKQRDTSPLKKKFVPLSCCTYSNTLKDYLNPTHCQFFSLGPPNNPTEFSSKNKYLNYDGCYDRAKDFVLRQSDIILALGFIFSFIMIAGMVLTFFMVRWISDGYDSDSHLRRKPEQF